MILVEPVARSYSSWHVHTVLTGESCQLYQVQTWPDRCSRGRTLRRNVVTNSVATWQIIRWQCSHSVVLSCFLYSRVFCAGFRPFVTDSDESGWYHVVGGLALPALLLLRRSSRFSQAQSWSKMDCFVGHGMILSFRQLVQRCAVCGASTHSQMARGSFSTT